MSFQYEYGENHEIIIFCRKSEYCWIQVGDDHEDILDIPEYDKTPVPENWELVY